MFTCETCGRAFDVRPEVLERYPGWTPRQCLDCRNTSRAARPDPPAKETPSATKYRDMTTAEVLARFTGGPQTGVFTDGSSEGNPGPGGWGAVLVVDGELVAQDYGSDPYTTNNRMELTGVVAGLRMLPPDADITLYTDSQLAVNIITKWAEGWEASGWKKKSPGPIANLELVKEAYALARQRPGVDFEWISAHSGNRWNEYADALATAYRRERV